MVQGDVERSESEEIGVNLATPETVRKLQTASYTKAKESPEYRFYTLYDDESFDFLGYTMGRYWFPKN